MYTQSVPELISKNVGNTLTNFKTWGGILYNVKDYGAVGNGIADDTSAIVAALAAGNRVYLPDGTYKIRPGVITLLNGQTIEGSNHRTATLVIDGANTLGITLLGVGSSISNIGIKHTGVTPISGAAINIMSSDVVVDNVFIQDCYDGIRVFKSSTQAVALIYLTRFYIEGLYNIGIYIENANDIYIDNFAINSLNTTAPAGIKLYKFVQAVSVSNGSVLNFNQSLVVDALQNTNTTRPAFNRFSQVYFDSSASGVLLNNCASLRFTSCWFSNRPGNGCAVGNTDDISFINCDFINNGIHGCYIDNTTKRTRFHGCSFISNNTENSIGTGLQIAIGTTDFVVQGCTATNYAGFPGTQIYGIYLGGATSDRFIIADNLVSGNVSSGVIDVTTTTNKRVANNY